MIEDDFLSNFTGAAEQMGNGRKIMVVAVGEEPPSIKASRTQSNPDSRGLHQPILIFPKFFLQIINFLLVFFWIGLDHSEPNCNDLSKFAIGKKVTS